MDRRKFIRTTLTASAAIGVPYILPSGRLFAATGNRKANHVVFCLFAGGVRNLESVHKNDGNLMPNMLNGIEPISNDIVGSLNTLPGSPLIQPLQNYGTLFKEFRFSDGPTGHFNGYVTAITGQNTNNTLSLRERPSFPTVFELYRKHANPSKAAINSWWVTNSNNLYPTLNYSQYPGYGSNYGANQISPSQLFSYNTGVALENHLEFTEQQEVEIEDLKEFMNFNFSSNLSLTSGIKNEKQDAEKIHAWLEKMTKDRLAGLHGNPWNIAGGMSGDMRNVFYAEEVLKEFKPELLMLNMSNVDVAHTSFSSYCNALQYADWSVAHLWNTIQSTPGLADDTILIVVPEIGRNATPNSIIDGNGRYALDHTTSDPMSRELFCLIAGPQGVVNQNVELSTVLGRSIDVVPTIADILDFKGSIPGLLPGSTLTQAFV